MITILIQSGNSGVTPHERVKGIYNKDTGIVSHALIVIEVHTIEYLL